MLTARVLLVSVLCTLPAAAAELRLAKAFGDHAILQRDRPVPIHGFAAPGETVALAFGGQQRTATADDAGRWQTTLAPMAADATGRDLVVRGADATVTARGILVGDVVLLARQASIDVSLGARPGGKAAAAASGTNPKLRVLRIAAAGARTPQPDLSPESTAGWAPIDRTTAPAMSAVGFHLSRRLANTTDAPLGIVDIDMGAYVAAAWLSPAGLDESETRFPDQGDLSYFRKALPERADQWASGELARERDKYYEKRMKGKGRKPSLGMAPLEFPYYPSAVYNAVLHPLRGLAARAMIVQIGNDYPMVTYARLRALGKITDPAELDRAWPQAYPMIKHANRMAPFTVPLIPADLRRLFGDALPLAMITPPGSDFFDYAAHNREMRELLRRIQRDAPGLGLILAGTEHVRLSGQPADDALLAERCSHWLLGAALGRDGATALGPTFLRAETGPGTATVHFVEGTAEGLHAEGEGLAQFEVSGPDQVFVPCRARIDGNTIQLTSDDVHYIQFVRYNWSHKPHQGLTNGAGLPAVPFTSQPDWAYVWWPPAPPPVYPPEYSLPANRWSESDVAIINGSLTDGNSGDSEPNPALIGPTGLVTDAFGPNLYVHRTEPGSPADGKVLPGDLIFGVNGTEFGDDQYRAMADAISFSESAAGKGTMTLGIRRGARIIQVAIQLETMGSYSATTPRYCPKSEKIVQRAEAWLERRCRPEAGLGGTPGGKHDTDLWTILATANPRTQGLVRRKIYAMMQHPPSTPDPNQPNNSWHIGYAGILLGEYFNATGDPNVLPYLESQAGWAAAVQLRPQGEEGPQEKAFTEQQIGGYRTRYAPNRPMARGGYGLMAAAGMPCVMTMLYAKEAGVDVDGVALERGLKHFNYRRAEYGDVIYWYHPLWRDRPQPTNPKAEAAGKLWSQNGKLGTAAALFNLAGYPTATDVCSRICTYSFNNTRHGHGGMFYNNLWTPIGAHIAGERAFTHFMRGQTWWRELYRRHDGSFNQVGRGDIGIAYALHYVAHKQRLRMLGAPKSAFCADPPIYLRPALAAHAERDYATAEAMVRKTMAERVIPAEELPVVHHLLDSLTTLRASIDHDLDYVEALIERDRYAAAALELAQLKGVVAANNPRLQAILKLLESDSGRQRIAASRKQEEAAAKTLQAEAKARTAKPAAPPAREDWICLVTSTGGSRDNFGREPENRATRWRMKVVETRDHAPPEWTAVDFDDADWDETTLPVSWRVSHTALFRGTFTIEDKEALKGLRLRGSFPRQQNIELFINGNLVAKINNCGNDATAPLTDYALEVARNGENTIAVVTTHTKRWGKVKGDYSTVFGFGVRLDASRKGE